MDPDVCIRAKTPLMCGIIQGNDGKLIIFVLAATILDAIFFFSMDIISPDFGLIPRSRGGRLGLIKATVCSNILQMFVRY